MRSGTVLMTMAAEVDVREGVQSNGGFKGNGLGKLAPLSESTSLPTFAEANIELTCARTLSTVISGFRLA
jgi:hypothetical protein